MWNIHFDPENPFPHQDAAPISPDPSLDRVSGTCMWEIVATSCAVTEVFEKGPQGTHRYAQVSLRTASLRARVTGRAPQSNR